MTPLIGNVSARKPQHRQDGRQGRTNRTATAIVRASSPRDFDAARSILARYREWLEGMLGGNLATFQPSALQELAALERFYTSPHGHLLVAMVGGKPAGVAGVQRLGPGAGELKHMYIAPEARGRGIGRSLAVAAVEAAGELGFDLLRLETRFSHLPVSVTLYRELGFREIEPYHSVAGVDGLLTMELRLTTRTRGSRPGRSGTAGTADHGWSRGRLSPWVAMLVRWVSPAPPPTVLATERRVRSTPGPSSLAGTDHSTTAAPQHGRVCSSRSRAGRRPRAAAGGGRASETDRRARYRTRCLRGGRWSARGSGPPLRPTSGRAGMVRVGRRPCRPPFWSRCWDGLRVK